MADATCSVENCERPVRCKALCNMHYIRFRTHGDVGADMPPYHQGSTKMHHVCTVEGCDRPHKAHGLCNMHIIRLRRHGDIQASVPGQIYVTTCQVDGCDSDAHAKGYCHAHYRKMKVHGDPHYVVEWPTVCSVSDCHGAVVAKGWCSRHYRRVEYLQNRLAQIAKVERRRAKRAAVARVPYSSQQLSWRFSMFGNRCWMCGSSDDLTVDHVKPLAVNGPDMPSNLRPACRSCNSRKRDRWYGTARLYEFIRT